MTDLNNTKAREIIEQGIVEANTVNHGVDMIIDGLAEADLLVTEATNRNVMIRTLDIIRGELNSRNEIGQMSARDVLEVLDHASVGLKLESLKDLLGQNFGK